MILPALFLGLALLAAGAVLAWRYARRADGDFFDLPARLIVTAIMLAPLAWVFIQGARNPGNPGLGIVGLGLVLVCGLLLAVLWVPAVTRMLLAPLFGAWTGGDEEVETTPFYSRAVAHRKHGRYAESLEEVRAQLERFPGDFTGLMLRAEIEADDLDDLPSALGTLTEILSTPGRDPGERAQAQFRIAEWQLQKASDPAAARETLERLRDENAGTEVGQRAAQRLAHLPGAAAPSAARAPLTVRVHGDPLGLSEDLGAGLAARMERAAEGDPEIELTRLNAHLTEHPADWEARERRIRIYLDHLGRPDLAHGELEHLIAQPGQPVREVVRWLNRLADLHLASGDTAAARLALDRIVDRYPDTAASEQADRRRGQLGLAVQGRRESPRLKLGTYEQNPGLRWGRPREGQAPAEEPTGPE